MTAENARGHTPTEEKSEIETEATELLEIGYEPNDYVTTALGDWLTSHETEDDEAASQFYDSVVDKVHELLVTADAMRAIRSETDQAIDCVNQHASLLSINEELVEALKLARPYVETFSNNAPGDDGYDAEQVLSKIDIAIAKVKP